MTVFFHFSVEGFSNSYIVVNLNTKTALFVDPGFVDPLMISHIEDNGYTPKGILVTHSHYNHIRGVSTLLKIYDIPVFAAEAEIAGHKTNMVSGDGFFHCAGFDIGHYSVPGHSPDSLMYKIRFLLFSGDALVAGGIGSTNGYYGCEILRKTINNKIINLPEETIILPGYGPPSTIKAEKNFNFMLKNPPQKYNSKELHKERDY